MIDKDEALNKDTGEILKFDPVPDNEVTQIGVTTEACDFHAIIRDAMEGHEDPEYIKPTVDEIMGAARTGISGPMAPIWAKWKDCTLCHLHIGRNQVVLGSGNSTNPKYVLVGEAPGEHEDQNGGPFVGRTGQLMTQVLDEVGINRVTECYLMNAACCRPGANVTPAREDLMACRPRLQEQLAVLLSRNTVQVIVLVGKPAYATFMRGPDLERTDFKVDSIAIGKRLGWVSPLALPKGYPRIYTIYHPSFIARRGHNPGELAAWKADWEAIKYWADEKVLLQPRKI